MFSNKRREIKRGIKALAKTVSVVISRLSCDDKLQNIMAKDAKFLSFPV